MGAAEDALVGPDDDNFHPHSDHPWETETCWYAFCVPERNLMGYLYTWIRPNLGICGGGTLVWDDTAYLPWEVPFFDYNHSIPLPEGLDLRDATLPTGMRVKVIEPLTSYELGYRYPYKDMFEAELRFDALTPPHVFTRGEPPFTIASHIDQPGRVTGRIRLHGDRHRRGLLRHAGPVVGAPLRPPGLPHRLRLRHHVVAERLSVLLAAQGRQRPDQRRLLPARRGSCRHKEAASGEWSGIPSTATPLPSRSRRWTSWAGSCGPPAPR